MIFNIQPGIILSLVLLLWTELNNKWVPLNNFLSEEMVSIAPSHLSDTTWKRLSWPYTASIRSFAETPGNFLYAGTTAGIYKSFDNGYSWKLIGLNENVIDELCVSDKGTLLAGTYRNGIFRSEDEGKIWNSVGLNKNIYVFGIIDNRKGIIFATGAYIIDGYSKKTPTGVFKSTDDGKTWIQTSLRDNAVFGLSCPKEGVLFASSNTKFYRSENNGESWTQIGKGLPSGIPVSNVIQFNNSLVASVGNRQDASRQGGGGIFQSVDNGLTWYFLGKGIEAGTKVSSIVSLNHMLFAGTGFLDGTGNTGIFKSVDSGKTWIPSGLNDGIIVRGIHISKHNLLFARTDGTSLYTSQDQGSKWQQIGKEFDNWETFKVFKKDNYLFVTSGASGVWRSSDHGVSWARILKRFTDLTILSTGRILLFDRNKIVASDDHGDTWIKLSDFEGGLVFFKNFNDSLVIACTDNNGLWYSRDSGISWGRYNITEIFNFRTVIMTPKGSLITGGNSPGILRQGKEDQQWKKVGAELGVWTFLYSEGILYAGTYTKGIFKSSDDGITWKPCNYGIVKNKLYPAITSLSLAKDNSILCTTLGKGILRTTNEGDSWHPYNAGLTNLHTWYILCDEEGQTYTATFKGIFTRKMIE